MPDGFENLLIEHHDSALLAPLLELVEAGRGLGAGLGTAGAAAGAAADAWLPWEQL